MSPFSTEDNMRTTITPLAAGLLLIMCATKSQQSVALQGPGAARGAAPSATPAPLPGSPGIYKSDAELTATLKKAIAAANGNQSSSPIANTDQYRINIVHREKAAGALAHEGNTELHYIIEGTGVVVTGGTIVRDTDGINSAEFTSYPPIFCHMLCRCNFGRHWFSLLLRVWLQVTREAHRTMSFASIHASWKLTSWSMTRVGR
jgi:hypothetical protein